MNAKVSEPDCGESPSEVTFVAVAPGDGSKTLSAGIVDSGERSSNGSCNCLIYVVRCYDLAKPYRLRPLYQRLGRPLGYTTTTTRSGYLRLGIRVHKTAEHTMPGTIGAWSGFITLGGTLAPRAPVDDPVASRMESL